MRLANTSEGNIQMVMETSKASDDNADTSYKCGKSNTLAVNAEISNT